MKALPKGQGGGGQTLVVKTTKFNFYFYLLLGHSESLRKSQMHHWITNYGDFLKLLIFPFGVVVLRRSAINGATKSSILEPPVIQRGRVFQNILL